MDVCVENVFITPAIEAINVIPATAEGNDRAHLPTRIMGIGVGRGARNCSAGLQPGGFIGNAGAGTGGRVGFEDGAAHVPQSA